MGGGTEIVEVLQMGVTDPLSKVLFAVRGWVAGGAVSQGGLGIVSTSLPSSASLTRETCTRAWLHVSQNKGTTSFPLLQQHITNPTCSVFKADLQKGHSLKALH